MATRHWKSAPPLTIGAWLRLDAIRRGLAILNPKRVLEVGPGLGAMAHRLASRHEYVGLERDGVSHAATGAVLNALGSGLVVHGEIADLARQGPFDAVCAFEVLEHQHDDVGALRNWSTVLLSGGGVVLSVPAKPERFGSWDQAVGHVRRYTRISLGEVLNEAGFEVVSLEAWGAGLGDVLEVFRNMACQVAGRPTSDEERTADSGRLLQPSSWTRGLVNGTAALPFRLLQYPLRSTNFGTGLVAVGRLRS